MIDQQLEFAVSILVNRIYKAALFFEDLEERHVIVGNGHHLAQDVARHTELLLRERWKPSEKENGDL